jgi:hypothetical protein
MAEGYVLSLLSQTVSDAMLAMGKSITRRGEKQNEVE